MVNKAKIIIEKLQEQSFTLAKIRENLASLSLNCDSKLLNQVFKNIKQNLLRVLESLDKIIILNPQKPNSFRKINGFCNSIQSNLSKARMEMDRSDPKSAIPNSPTSSDACSSLGNHYENLAKIYLEILEPYHQDIGRLDNPEVKLYDPNSSYDISNHRKSLINTISYLGSEYCERYFLFMNSSKLNHQDDALLLKLYTPVLNSLIATLNPKITSIIEELKSPSKKGSQLDELIKEINKLRGSLLEPIDEVSLRNALNDRNSYSNLIKDLRDATLKNEQIRVQDFTRIVFILNELMLKKDSHNHIGLNSRDILYLRQLAENDTRNQDGYAILENIYRKTLYILEPFNHREGLIYVHGNISLSDEAKALTEDLDVKISMHMLKKQSSKIDFIPSPIDNLESEISKIHSKYKIILIKSGIDLSDLKGLCLTFNNNRLKKLITKIYSTALAQNSINLKQAAELIYILASGLKKEPKANNGSISLWGPIKSKSLWDADSGQSDI